MLLIRLTTPTEQACYEGCALALTLATFGHKVQLYLDSTIFGVLLQSSSRLHGMIKSLELYDLPPAWLPQENSSGWLIGMLPAGVASQVCLVPTDAPIKNTTQVLSF